MAKDVADCIEHSNVSKMCELCRDKDKVVVRPSDLTSNDLLDVKNREYTAVTVTKNLVTVTADSWFVAKAACKCLELKDDAGTICRELDEQDKVTLSREEFMGGVSNRGIICSVDSRVQLLVFVSESGLYDLIREILQLGRDRYRSFKRRYQMFSGFPCTVT